MRLFHQEVCKSESPKAAIPAPVLFTPHVTVEANYFSFRYFQSDCSDREALLNHVRHRIFFLSFYVIESQDFEIAFSTIGTWIFRKIFNYKLLSPLLRHLIP